MKEGEKPPAILVDRVGVRVGVPSSPLFISKHFYQPLSQFWRTKSEEQVTDYRLEVADEHYIKKMMDPPGLWRVPELWKDGQLALVSG